ncbi:TPA_asm: HK97 gp10 family phage protein [Listeria monocytogenes]|uniref:HK97-gp10 family putative phage morphogenesis protein n=1 Tax=Listeria monocytogenes TaxID=1639 RepID=UPI0017561E28|nr:HK97-gp10 family putative phage morphogenesis protein [Listeria monocytogenes]MCI2642796.1 HK97 gp10 family phage protein [Listeria monocytogenes]MCP8211949.1 HK97 gp10 family phage protein [Listeria monocytogenes]HAA8671024.1 HK97 gp10 family phage protein [Listeria monocytogenes]HAA9322378.1 HK97 gp10 family phage protein [Listeria monocytogenes]HAA9338139.1 HK97 gp10 family phage protein [Listeria monocytogenes]
MAKVDIKVPDDFLLKISKLGSDFDPVAEKVLKAGGEVIFKRTKSNLSAVIGKGTKHESRSTGELEKALGVTSVRLDRNGNHNIKIGFSEPRPDGESNAKIANILEYGKHGQPAKPFLKPARSASKSECISVMKSTFEEEVKKL